MMSNEEMQKEERIEQALDRYREAMTVNAALREAEAELLRKAEEKRKVDAVVKLAQDLFAASSASVSPVKRVGSDLRIRLPKAYTVSVRREP